MGRRGNSGASRVKIDVHFKTDMQNPTACGIWDKWPIWSGNVYDVTCAKCVDVMDMRAP